MSQDIQCDELALMTDKRCQMQELPSPVADKRVPFPFLSKKSGGGYIAVPTDEAPLHGVAVIKDQPISIVKPGLTSYPLNDHFLTLSIVLTVLCFLSGTWYSLCCTIPAIVMATLARKAEAHGNLTDAHNRAQLALLLNMIALVTWIIALVVIVLSVGIVISGTGSKGSYCKINENYNYYQCNN